MLSRLQEEKNSRACTHTTRLRTRTHAHMGMLTHTVCTPINSCVPETPMHMRPYIQTGTHLPHTQYAHTHTHTHTARAQTNTRARTHCMYVFYAPSSLNNLDHLSINQFFINIFSSQITRRQTVYCIYV